MKADFYLIINNKKVVRLVKNLPRLDWSEVSIKMNLELPDSLFQRPVLSGSIVVKDSDVQPTVITPEIMNNIQQAIREHQGIEIKLSIAEDNTPQKEL